MRIATRLVLILGSLVIALMGMYMVVSHQQHKSLLREGMIRETEAMARTLQVVSNATLAEDRTADLDRTLRTATADEEIFASLVIDAQGRVLAGRAENLACLQPHLRSLPARREERGWARCPEQVYWRALPLDVAGTWLVVGLEAVMVNRSVTAALRRQLALTLALSAALALTLLLILHRMLSLPLDEILRGLRSLAATGEPPRLQVPSSAGDLAHLAAAFNEMAEQLVRNREQLLHEAEERVTLQRRLHEAEMFAMAGRLSGGLAHELGSPLSVISIRAEAILASREVPPEVRRQAETILQVVSRMTEFIHGLLHLHRRQGVVFEPLDLVQLVRALQKDIAATDAAEGVAVEVELPSGPVMVYGQETLLRHALRNLIHNAEHALRQRPAGEQLLRIRVEPSEHEVRLYVEDSGPGVSPEHMHHIFEPFFTTKEVGEGIGLGLPISRGIIEEHGGELRLENLPEGGVRAVITLPLSAMLTVSPTPG